MKDHIGLLSICAFILCWLIAVPCSASERPRVVHVLDADASGAEEPGLSAQLSAELRAVGFDVRETRMSGAEDAGALREAASSSGSIAAIATSRSGDSLIARVWLTDKKTQLESVESMRVSLNVDEPIRVLALRVAELLHAKSLELSIAQKESPPDTPSRKEPAGEGSSTGEVAPRTRSTSEEPVPPGVRPSTAQGKPLPARAVTEAPTQDHGPVPPETAPGRTRQAIAVGATALGGPGGLGVGFSPAIIVSFRVSDPIAVDLSAAGPAIGSAREASASVSFDQEILAARLRYELRADPWAPFVVGGIGGYRIGARGTAPAPHRATSDSAISALATAGAGLRLSPTRNLALLAEADAMFVTPRPVLRVVDRSMARTGRPLYATTLAAELQW